LIESPQSSLPPETHFTCLPAGVVLRIVTNCIIKNRRSFPDQENISHGKRTNSGTERIFNTRSVIQKINVPEWKKKGGKNDPDSVTVRRFITQWQVMAIWVGDNSKTLHNDQFGSHDNKYMVIQYDSRIKYTRVWHIYLFSASSYLTIVGLCYSTITISLFYISTIFSTNAIIFSNYIIYIVFFWNLYV